MKTLPVITVFISHNRVQRADRHCGYNRNDDTGQALSSVCVCVHVPAVLLAAVAEEPFLLVAARGVGVAFGTVGRLSPFSGVWKSQQRGDKLWGVCTSLRVQ